MQGVLRPNEPPVREEGVRLGPVGRVAVEGLVHDPYVHAVRGVLPAVRSGDDAGGGSGAEGRGGGEEAEGLLDGGGGVGDLVD